MTVITQITFIAVGFIVLIKRGQDYYSQGYDEDFTGTLSGGGGFQSLLSIVHYHHYCQCPYLHSNQYQHQAHCNARSFGYLAVLCLISAFRSLCLRSVRVLGYAIYLLIYYPSINVHLRHVEATINMVNVIDPRGHQEMPRLHT